MKLLEILKKILGEATVKIKPKEIDSGKVKKGKTNPKRIKKIVSGKNIKKHG